MTSIGSKIRQISSDEQFFIALADLSGSLYSWDPSASTMTNAAGGWYKNVVTKTYINAAGKLLRDMGKTVFLGTSTFRKVQAVVPGSGANSTFGVSGSAGTSPNTDYLTAYILLGVEGNGAPTRVAKFGR